MRNSRAVKIIDVTARDGLQNESVMFSTEDKVDLIGRSISAGARRLEVASFAHPKYVPQMADAESVIAALPKNDDVIYIGLAMNCLLYTSPSPRDQRGSRMPSSA